MKKQISITARTLVVCVVTALVLSGTAFGDVTSEGHAKPDIQASFTNSWGTIPPLYIFNNPATLTTIYFENLTGIIDDATTIKSSCGQSYYNYKRYAIARQTIINNEKYYITITGAATGSYPGIEGSVTLFNNWTIEKINSKSVGDYDNYFRNTTNTINFRTRGACPACACYDGGYININITASKQDTIPTYPTPTPKDSDGDGLVAEWHFDGDAKDSSGNGNDGVIHGATFIDGISGKALSFDGIDDYVNYGNDESFDQTTDFTYEAWVKRAGDFGSIQNILAKNSISTNLYGAPTWFFGSSNKVAFVVQNIAIIGSSNTAITDTNWHYIAITRDSYDNWKWYIDGNLDGSVVNTIKVVPNSKNVYIGTGHDNWLYNGLIDEVRIYNRALTANEIQANYDVVLNPPDTTPPSISISPPSNGQSFDTDTITISGTASDDREISKIEVKVDYGSWQSASGTTSWSKSIILNSSLNTIYARATDTSGNVNETSMIVGYYQHPPTSNPTTTTTPPTPEPTATSKDSDGDGWSDEKEISIGTNPYSVDSDSDGINDPHDPNPNVPEKTMPGFGFVLAFSIISMLWYLRKNKL